MTESDHHNVLAQVLSQYQCSINNTKVEPLGNGLINQTYLIKNSQSSFVLQKINHHVFKHPVHIIENAQRINQHLLAKKQQGHYPLATIEQIPTINQQFMVTLNGEFWRALRYIDHCYSVDKVTTAIQAKQVAQAFGQFSSALSDFPANSLHRVIPNFHNLSVRLDALKTITTTKATKRLSQCQELVDFCFQQQVFIDEVIQLSEQLPIRVTHNDTKIDNLLFCSSTNKPLAVIDLDTAMPSYLMHDFGDMVRTCCSTLPEDSAALARLSVRFDIFGALAQGYLETFGETITAQEKHSLITGSLLMPFMLAVRFLVDYLDGDRYFHIDHAEHNLDRAKNQLALFRLLQQKRTKLSEIVFSPTNTPS